MQAEVDRAKYSKQRRKFRNKVLRVEMERRLRRPFSADAPSSSARSSTGKLKSVYVGQLEKTPKLKKTIFGSIAVRQHEIRNKKSVLATVKPTVAPIGFERDLQRAGHTQIRQFAKGHAPGQKVWGRLSKRGKLGVVGGLASLAYQGYQAARPLWSD